ncbi:Cytochrome c2 [Polaribacter huanghezhanensis]|uniref:c-type cytochrome n=1 Tax=Polaribacter huanghezhanensis TaxID=1354726 RepID=UPI002649B4A7|nr:cytochrome c [Polaribacter huanghezhanensis]WKD86580.1 Cytochrome c2 [Polaribacter huanghezhanensis]
MKLKIIIAILAIGVLTSCSSDEKKQLIKTKTVKKAAVKTAPEKKEVKKEKVVRTVDLNNKGIGSIKSVTLGNTIDKSMADNGQKIFKNKCSACHRADKKFIGPSPTGIIDRRSPEWIMNMILNPQEMTDKDPIAKELLAQFNGVPMADQNIKEKEARAILEYFRTLK